MSGRFGGGGWGFVDSIWNVMAHVTHGRGKWRGNWRMEWVACTLHTASEHGVSSITTADAHTSAVSSRLNWRPRRYKWTLPFRRKTKSGFYACATTFQKQSTSICVNVKHFELKVDAVDPCNFFCGLIIADSKVQNFSREANSRLSLPQSLPPLPLFMEPRILFCVQTSQQLVFWTTLICSPYHS